MFRQLASLIAALLLGSAAQAATVLNLSAYVPTSHPLVKDGLAQWAKEVEQATKGNVSVRILATPLGKPEAHFEMARDGVADIALGVPGYTPGRFVLIEVAGAPNVANSATGLSVGLWNTYSAFPEMQKEFEGVKTLGVLTTSPMHFYNTKREIKSLDDFKGLKSRVAGGLMAEVAKSLGMVAILQPAGKAYELLSGGVADAVIFPQETIKSFKLEGLIKHATLIPGGLTAVPIFLVMNQAKFDALPKEDQTALMNVSGAHLAKITGAVWDRLDKDGTEALRAAGGDIKTASPELTKQIFAATDPALATWLTETKEKRGVDGQAILAKFRAEVAKAEGR